MKEHIQTESYNEVPWQINTRWIMGVSVHWRVNVLQKGGQGDDS